MAAINAFNGTKMIKLNSFIWPRIKYLILIYLGSNFHNHVQTTKL
jgi:DNA-directed RNA polymerase specialized sigma subunit